MSIPGTRQLKSNLGMLFPHALFLPRPFFLFLFLKKKSIDGVPLSNRFVFLLHPCCDRTWVWFTWKVFFVPSFGCDQELSPSVLPQLRTQWMKAYALNEVRPSAYGFSIQWQASLSSNPECVLLYTMKAYQSVAWADHLLTHKYIAYMNPMNIKKRCFK